MADHVETRAEKILRLAGELKVRRVKLGNLQRRARQHAKRIKLVRAALKRLRAPAVPGNVNGWHPQAIRNQIQPGIGSFSNVPPRGVLHTTEGTSLPGYKGSHPHLTVDFKRRLFYQHIPITSGAMALVNAPGGVETNRDHAIQFELIGFARESQDWTDGDYAFIAELMRWAEKNFGVPRQCTVTFVGNGNTNHLSFAAWDRYTGWCGHQHVPENLHWDPGTIKIGQLL